MVCSAACPGSETSFYELAGIERLLHFVHELQETQPGIDVLLGASDLLGQHFDRVGLRLQLHQRGIATCLVEFVHVGALQVLDELQFEALRVTEFANRCRNGFALRELRGAVAPRSGNEFILARLGTRQGANKDGLQNPVPPDVVGEFGEFPFVKLAARVCANVREDPSRF